MTVNEIIKALECLHKRILRSNFAREVTEDEIMAIVDALSLINRQKAEIERLTAERDEARQDCAVAEHNHQLAVAEREANVKGFTETLKTAKADGIIEFWNTLKARNTMDERIVSVVTGDNLVKEMVGDKNENESQTG